MRFGKYGPRRPKSRMMFSPRAKGVCCLTEDGGGSPSARQSKHQEIRTIEKRKWKREVEDQKGEENK